jgi:hypothetical protein
MDVRRHSRRIASRGLSEDSALDLISKSEEVAKRTSAVEKRLP